MLDVSSGLSEVGANQRHANQGIFILCKAVGELMQVCFSVDINCACSAAWRLLRVENAVIGNVAHSCDLLGPGCGASGSLSQRPI